MKGANVAEWNHFRMLWEGAVDKDEASDDDTLIFSQIPFGGKKLKQKIPFSQAKWLSINLNLIVCFGFVLFSFFPSTEFPFK